MVLNNDHSNELFCNEAQSIINPIHRLAAKYKYTTSICRPRLLLWFMEERRGGNQEENTRFVCLFVYIDATSRVTRNAFTVGIQPWSFNTTTRYWTDSSEFWKPIAVDSCRCDRLWFHSSCCWMLGSAVQYSYFILIQDYWSVRRRLKHNNKVLRGRLLIFGDHPPPPAFFLYVPT